MNLVQAVVHSPAMTLHNLMDFSILGLGVT